MSVILGQQRWLAIRPAAPLPRAPLLREDRLHRRWVFQRDQPANACRKPRIGLADDRAEILRIALDFREREFPWLPQKRLDHFHRDSPPLLLRGVELGNLDIARKVILEIRHRLL